MPCEQSTFTSHLHVIEKRKPGETAESDVYAPTHLSGVTPADLIPMSMEVGFTKASPDFSYPGSNGCCSV